MTEPYYSEESLEPMNSIGFLIKRCGVLMSQLAERMFESQQISFTQWLVLIRLRFHEHMSATQISEEMGHDMGALTRVVDALERAGFVRRERSRRDRRAVEIAITEAGRRQVDGTMPFVVHLLNELVVPYSKKEVDCFIHMLQCLLNRLHELSETDLVPPPVALEPRPAAAGRKTAARATAPNKPARKAKRGDT
ncbi:MAG: MarR family transcriptional regulator [Nevskia sp.]|nr:MarR family transcriptional regulator [Nevskia sp.]